MTERSEGIKQTYRLSLEENDRIGDLADGYDGPCHFEPPLTPDERADIARHMVALWARWGGIVLTVLLAVGCGGSVEPEPTATTDAAPEVAADAGCYMGVDNKVHRHGDDAGVPVLTDGVDCK